MRVFFTASLLVWLSLGAGCDWRPGQRTASPERRRDAPAGGGLSLHPLSAGEAGQPAWTTPDADYGNQPSAPFGQPSYQAEERVRAPSPYDPLLRGRYQPSWPGSPAVSPVYAVSPLPPAPAGSGAIAYRQSPSALPESAASPGAAGLRLVPATDIPPGGQPGDAGPSQWFEVVRPDNGPLRIGRLSTTCVCIGARAPKRQIAAGERALIEVRTLTRPPRNQVVYGLYVGILEPEKVMLDADVAVRQ